MMIFDKGLHSCPLCGATDIYFEEKYFGGMTQIDVGCSKCGLKGSKSFLSNTLKENYDYLPQIFTQEAFVRYIDECAEPYKA